MSATAATDSATDSGGSVAVMSVSITPGAIALTRIPLGANSLAAESVSPTSAAFDAE